MKVYLGPFKYYFGPYQIADLLQKVGVSEDTCHKIGERLDKTWLKPICEFIYKYRQRVERIKIHNYDAWNLGDTVAKIALPLMQEFKRQGIQGAPFVDDEDVPEYLRSTNAPPLTEEEQNYGGVDKNWHPRWEWVVEEIIWALGEVNDPDAEDKLRVSIDPSKPWNEPGIPIEQSLNRYRFDMELYKAWADRKQNGLRLFGKYLEAIWN